MIAKLSFSCSFLFSFPPPLFLTFRLFHVLVLARHDIHNPAPNEVVARVPESTPEEIQLVKRFRKANRALSVKRVEEKTQTQQYYRWTDYLV